MYTNLEELYEKIEFFYEAAGGLKRRLRIFMTTKYKVIFGFLLMLLLLGGVSFIGYQGFNNASDSFAEYDRLSKFNVNTSDIELSVFKSAYEVNRALVINDFSLMDKGMDAIKRAKDLVDDSLALVHKPERKQTLEEMQAYLDKYAVLITAVKDGYVDAHNEYDNKITPSFQKMTEAFDSISGMAQNVGNLQVLYGISLAWDDVAHAAIWVGSFAETYDPNDGDKANEYLENAAKAVSAIGSQLITEEGRRTYAVFMDQFRNFADSFKQMEEVILAGNKNMDEMRNLRNSLLEKTNMLNKDMDATMREYSAQTLASNVSMQKMLLGVGSVGLVLGILFAVLIITSVVRMLSHLSKFAGQIANGDFKAKLEIKEKGEVGQTIAAILEIPATLNSMADEYNRLERQVEEGYLDVRGNVSKFSGGFADLVQGTNHILESMGVILNNIPSPMVMLNKDLKAAYLNQMAQNLVGTDYKGRSCEEMFHREDYGTETCGLRNAVRSNEIHSSETVAHPKGQRMDIRYTRLSL